MQQLEQHYNIKTEVSPFRNVLFQKQSTTSSSSSYRELVVAVDCFAVINRQSCHRQFSKESNIFFQFFSLYRQGLFNEIGNFFLVFNFDFCF